MLLKFRTSFCLENISLQKKKSSPSSCKLCPTSSFLIIARQCLQQLRFATNLLSKYFDCQRSLSHETTGNKMKQWQRLIASFERPNRFHFFEHIFIHFYRRINDTNLKKQIQFLCTFNACRNIFVYIYNAWCSRGYAIGLCDVFFPITKQFRFHFGEWGIRVVDLIRFYGELLISSLICVRQFDVCFFMPPSLNCGINFFDVQRLTQHWRLKRAKLNLKTRRNKNCAFDIWWGLLCSRVQCFFFPIIQFLPLFSLSLSLP